MVIVSCPKCHQQIELTIELEIGFPVTCQSCEASLEVIWLYPLSLDFTESPTHFLPYQDKNPD